jgi:hypothetical protein
MQLLWSECANNIPSPSTTALSVFRSKGLALFPLDGCRFASHTPAKPYFLFIIHLHLLSITWNATLAVSCREDHAAGAKVISGLLG